MDKIYITSLQNTVVKQVKELLTKKSARKKQGLFVVEGLRGVKEIPDKLGQIEYVVATEAALKTLPETVQAPKCYVVSEAIFEKISETKSPQGVLAIVKIPATSLDAIDMGKGPYLVLENLQDPGNLGTIIRSAHAFNFKGIFLTKGCVDPYAPKVVRATMSSLFYMPMVIDQDMETYVAHFKSKGVPLYVTALAKEAQPIREVSFKPNAALVIGNEGNGVTPYCLEVADSIIMIPMPGHAESLNASVAAAICMYEMTCSSAHA